MNRFALALLCGTAALGTASAHSADLLINDQPSVNNSFSIGSGGWDGFYAGVFAGYGFGNINQTGDVNTADLTGWLGGVKGGLNYTVGQGVVLGATADLALADVGIEDDGDYAYKMGWVGTVQARVGMDAGAFLPYVSGGIALAGLTANELLPTAGEDKKMHTGWTIGGGVEVSLMQNLSLDVNYRYIDLGEQEYSLGSGDNTIKLTSSAITAGLNYKF